MQIYSFIHCLTYSLTHLFNPLFPHFLTYLCILPTVTEKLHWARWSAWPLGIKWCTQSHLSSPRWTEDWWKSGSQLSQGMRKTVLLAINFCSLQALQTQSSCKKWKAHLVSLTLLLVGRSILSTPDAWGPQPLLWSSGCKIVGWKSVLSSPSVLDIMNQICICFSF